MSKKIKPEEIQDLTTEELRDVVEGAIVEILGDELIVVEAPEQERVKITPPEFKVHDGFLPNAAKVTMEQKVFEFQARGHNHNAIAAMLGVDSDLIKEILESGR
jgi:shikimate kinase